jgi:hypothetical protein
MLRIRTRKRSNKTEAPLNSIAYMPPMAIDVAPSPDTLVGYGVVLIGIGSVISVIGLLKDAEMRRVLPAAIVSLAFGSVLTLAPQYEQGGEGVYLAVITGIAVLAFVYAIVGAVRALANDWRKRIGKEDDRANQQEQSIWPIRTDVDGEQHPPTVGAGTLSVGEKSLANAVVAIAVGLMLCVQGLRLLARGR